MALNKLQQAVVDSNDKRIVCLAGAGSGKSFTLLSRIDRLIESGIAADSILALTFTNAAAREMLNRFKRNHTEVNITPRFSTFHAFCYSLIVTDINIRTALGYSKIPMICSDATLKRFYAEAEQATGISPKSLDIQNKPTKITLLEKKDQEIFLKYVRRKLVENNFITFEMMCNDVCNLFIDNNEIILKYKDKYSCIFVDEFQDTDKLQWKFVQSFSDASIFVCGDTLQAIYAFRGADDSIIKALCKDDKWKKYPLKTNYRSDSSIIKYANNFSTYADKSYRIEMDSVNDGGIINDIKYSNFKDQDGLILKYLDTSKDTAILARTNKEIYFIQQMLKDNDIKFRNNHTTPNHTGVELCRSIEDDEYAIDWLSSFLNQDVYNQFLRDCLALSTADKFKLLPKFIGDNKTLSNMYHCYTYLKKLYNENDLERIAKYLVYEVHTSSRVLNSHESIADIVDILETNSNDTNSIYVGTIHSVKGLEFDNVIVTGVNTKAFSLEYEENKNLFYVAITRAKHNLTILRRS